MSTTIAFFGATGGCALRTLSDSLHAGYHCNALVRSSSKLQRLLKEQGVTDEAVNAHLTINEGSVSDQSLVQKNLRKSSSQGGADTVVDIIVSGIGGIPKLQLSLFTPVTLDQPSICYDSTTTILAALRDLKSAGVQGKPVFVAISTTGVTKGIRDVPLAFVPLYHWFLAVPHVDKARMEEELESTSSNADTSPVEGFVAVRPSLLMDGNGSGPEKLRVGWEGIRHTGGPGPEVGYTIQRGDVGAWIFQNLIQSSTRNEWNNRYVTLTS